MVDDDFAYAVSIHGLRKSYGGVAVVRDLNLEIRSGEIFALLGPNGAGKTTTVEMLEGLRKRDSGELRVLGSDPDEGQMGLKGRIGIVLQQNGVDRYLTVTETLEMYASLYENPRPIDEVLELAGLSEKRDARALRLSGGQQRRLDVAIALVGDPDLLFLDEPTTGFDPTARREAWEVIRNLAQLGKTVLLTTHYMDEAQYLADTVAVIVAGRIVASGPPATLGHREMAKARIRYRPNAGASPPGHLVGPVDADGFSEILTEDVTTALFQLTRWAMESGSPLEGLEVIRPSLEDVYLALIALPADGGHATERLPDGESAPTPPAPAIERGRPPQPARVDRMVRSLALTVSQLRYVNKAFWRNPSRVFFTFAFPLMFLVIFTSLVGNYAVHLGTRTVTSATYYVASMSAFAVISACFNNLAASITYQREAGILKRLKGTPLPRVSFLGARIAHATLVSLLLVALTAAFGRTFYGADIPTGLSLARFVLMLVVGSISFCALGLALTGAIPNADSSEVIINAVILPLLFLSGIFIPLGDATPSWMVWTARIFPIKHFVDGMQSGFLGTQFGWSGLVIVAGWGIGGLLLALRYFRWEPTM